MKKNIKILKKPPLYPPNYLFSIVWPILYIMIGFTYYNILYNSGCIPYGYSKCGITIKYVKSLYLIIPTLALIFNFCLYTSFFQ